jgi:hypothetical protein
MGTKESDSPAPILLPFLHLAATTALTKQGDNPHRKDTTLDHLSAPNLFAHPTCIGARRSLVAFFKAPHTPNPCKPVRAQRICVHLGSNRQIRHPQSTPTPTK